MRLSNPDLEFITIGRILAPWGVKGKLKVKIETDFPQRFASGAKVYISQQPMTIDSAEWHSGKLIIKLSNIDSSLWQFFKLGFPPFPFANS